MPFKFEIGLANDRIWKNQKTTLLNKKIRKHTRLNQKSKVRTIVELPNTSTTPRMLLKNKYLSPDHRVNVMMDRNALGTPANLLNRYASVKYLERNGKTSDTQVPLRKRIENYVYSSADIIGEGFTSKVYKAHRDGSEELFAIKVVDLKKYSASNREMLESQINILKSLSHPNIIKCFDVFMTLNNCYIVTQYCDGGDLLSMLRKNRRPDRNTVNKIFRQVLQGYNHLAKNNIVHRDIKPANILFHNGKCKIADFGFAKKLDALKQKQNYNVGTPLYMPPEALLHNKYSFQSDIFSLGIMFYEMIVGSAPWQSRSEKELIAKMTRQPLKFPTNIVIDKEIKDMIAGCLSIDHSERFTPEKLMNSEFVSMLLGNPEQISTDQDIKDTSHKLAPLKNNYSTPKLSTVPSLAAINSPSPSLNTTPATSANATLLHQRYLTLLDPNNTKRVDKHKSMSTAEASEAEEADRKKIHDRNSTILLTQINFCRFMYYLAKNKIPLMRMKNQKEKLNIILFKHILKVMAKLDSPNNNFKLADWEQYSRSTQYQSLLKTIKDYHNRYVFEFGVYKSKLQVLQQVDDAVPFLSLYEARDLDREFYRMVSSYIKLHIKEVNINLGMDCKKGGFSEDMGASVEGLKALLKYFNLLDMLGNNFEDYEYFMQHSSICVVTDFWKNSNTESKYTQLKERISLLAL